MVASAAGLVADSAVGTYVMVLAQAFLSIDWACCSIEIALDGSTRIVRRRPEQRDDINIWLQSSQVNAADNVTHEFVATCRTALNNVTSRLPEALSRALKGQEVPDKDKRLQEALSSPTPPIVASEAPPAATLPMEADTSTAAAASAACQAATIPPSAGSPLASGAYCALTVDVERPVLHQAST